ncbi:unnamed protein product [Oncorhynchus mykiss]|nr:unnamed protein product [Oncorhynchus mykiss]
MPNSNRVPRPYFFDDPAGEDADSGVPWVNSSHPHQSWYGSIKETTPLVFASNPLDQNQHHSFYSTPQN